MKLRTLFCNRTALKKDITRFAPAWALYSVMLLLTLFIMASEGSDYSRTEVLVSHTGFMVVLNMIYGYINGQILFGDLFNTRHCNALHAMPLRRECWYMTHVIAGLLFSLVPNTIFALAVLPLLGTGAMMALYWLVAVTLQYLFFFGLAVCSALCVGNRFAMALVYTITNFLSMIIYVLYYNLYQPLLEGVEVSEEVAYRFCPVVQMMTEDNILMEVLHDNSEVYAERKVAEIVMGDGWGYLAVCAVIGVALLGLALALYRRRKLESAGDFMALKALEPVFLVLYTMALVVFFYMFGILFEMDYLFMGVGVLVGYFTGRMLLMRTTRVFQPKAFLWLAVFVAVLVGSLLVTAADPLGLTKRVPARAEVEQVKVSTSYNPKYGNEPFLTETEDIELARRMHRMILDGQGETKYDDMSYITMSFLYELENGTSLIRSYPVAINSPVGVLFEAFGSRPEFVLGSDEVDTFMDGMYSVHLSLNNSDVGGDMALSGNEDLVCGLAEALMADCAAGTMNQEWAYQNDAESVGWLEFNYRTQDGVYRYVSVRIDTDDANTVAYLKEYQDIFQAKFG